jgi:hypothetical protein
VAASRTGRRGATSTTVSASHRPVSTARRPARRADAASAAAWARTSAASTSSSSSFPIDTSVPRPQDVYATNGRQSDQI